MVVRGRVRNGRIEIDEQIALPEGAAVEISIQDAASGTTSSTQRTMYDRLARFIGAVTDLPADMSSNHDQYLYGRPSEHP